MAAGGMGRSRGPTLAERSAATRPTSEPAPTPKPAGVGASPRRRHCWVTGPDPVGGPWPGLVAEWQKATGGWRARVVYVVGDANSATTVETWVDASHLQPA